MIYSDNRKRKGQKATEGNPFLLLCKHPHRLSTIIICLCLPYSSSTYSVFHFLPVAIRHNLRRLHVCPSRQRPSKDSFNQKSQRFHHVGTRCLNLGFVPWSIRAPKEDFTHLPPPTHFPSNNTEDSKSSSSWRHHFALSTIA